MKDETPYLSGRREWNERYGAYIKAANNWRLAALGAVGVALVCSGGLVAVSLQTKVVPYAVEFNEHSEPVRVTRVDVMQAPSSNQIRAALRSWIIGARTVYADRRAMQDRIDATYAMTLPDSAALQAIAEYHGANNPYLRAEQETVEVSVNAVMAVSDDTWQVEWTETTKQPSGRILSKKSWQASLTISIIPPTTDAQILVNPTGVYVRQLAWTERI